MSLREELFAAVAQGDLTLLGEIIASQEAEILANFPEWQTVPPEVRTDPESMHHYANGLITVAVYFAKERDQPELLNLLRGDDDDNPITIWQTKLDEVQNLRDELEFGRAVELVNDLLIDMRGLTGDAVDFYLPRTLGLLGDLHFQNGSFGNAITSTSRALEHCESQADSEGILSYLGNLYEMHRYRSETELAAGYAERLAGLPGPNASWYGSQARIVRQGEPLNRVVVEVDGQRSEVEDSLPEGQLAFVFQRNRISMFSSGVWTQRGMKLGSQGRLEEALGAFREAAKADRYDPDPHYQAAATNLYLEHYYEAVEDYGQAERLAPGWFHCRANAWLAEEAAQRRISHQVLLLIMRSVDGVPDPKEALPAVLSALEETPQVALLDVVAAGLFSALGEEERAVEHLRAGLQKDPDVDTRTRLLFELAVKIDEPREKHHLLSEAASLDGNLVAAATARLLLNSEEP